MSLRIAGCLALLVLTGAAPATGAPRESSAESDEPKAKEPPEKPATDEPEDAPEESDEDVDTKPVSDADREIEELVGPQWKETLVVTASRTEESVLEAPVSVTVIGEEQIETSPAQSVTDLLRGVPGLNAVQTSARQLAVTTRTASSSLANSQLVLVDGRSVYQDFFGLVLWDALPVDLDQLESVEVLRGPGSAVWGANALSGVVHLRTKSPRDDPGGRLSIKAGEQATRSASLRWAQAFERASWSVTASWWEQEPWPRENTFADGTPIPDEAEFDNEGNEQPKLDLRLDTIGRHGTWSFRASHAGTLGIMHTGIGPFLIERGATFRSVSASHERDGLEARLDFNDLDGDSVNLLNRLPFAFESLTGVAEVTARRTVGRHRLVFGGNLRTNDFDLSLAPGEDQRVEAGAHFAARLRVAERWEASVGGRLDWGDTVGFTASPRLSLRFEPSAGRSLRLTWSRAFRAPSLINNYLDTAVPNRTRLSNGNDFVFVTFAEGSTEISEETVDAVEVGWTQGFRNTLLTAAVYRNETSDVIEFAPAEYYSAEDPPAGLPPEEVPERELVKRYAYRNGGGAVDQGVELSAESVWRGGVFTTASWTWQDAPDVSSADPEEPLVVNIPARHQLAFKAGWRRDRTQGSVGLSWTGRAFWSDVLDDRFWGWTDPYFLVDASFAVALGPLRDDEKGVTLRLGGTNLLDERVKQHVFGDVIGRRLTLEARWRF